MKTNILIALIFTTLSINAQTSQLRLHPAIILPKDSLSTKQLIGSIKGFLGSAQGPIEQNRFVLESERIETGILLDEFKEIEKNRKLLNDNFYKPYLTNLVPLKDSNYLIQLSYIGTTDSLSVLRASFEFLANRVGDSYLFSSPLIKNTSHWKEKKSGQTIFHFQHSINEQNAKKYIQLVKKFDAKLKIIDWLTEIYCTDNITDLQKLIGVTYKSDYNGKTQSVWSTVLGKRKLIVLGNNNANFNEFDPHDLFHDQLSLRIPRSQLNRPVDEGCAYLYGGSWGLSWKEIFVAFKEQIASNPTTNWLEIKEKPVYFKTKGFNNSADYIVNALLIQKIEKEKGFEGVWELLSVGPAEKGNEKYYQKLEQLTGISKASYQAKVWELINQE